MPKIIKRPAENVAGHQFQATTYFQIGKIRFVWHEGSYAGWYKFK